MKKIVMLFVASLLLIPATLYGQETGRYLVTIKAPVNDAVVKAGGRVIHQFHIVSGIAIEVPAQAVNGLLRNPNVVSIEPDVLVQAVPTVGTKPVKSLAPKGGSKGKPPKSSEQPPQVLEWNISCVGADLTWPETTGAGVTVSVIDTGIDKDHPDVAVNIAGGVNFVPRGRKLDPNKWDDDNGHGTHVAGIIAAVDNDIGVVGVAPDAKLYGVKVLDARGSGWLSDVVAGIEWSVDRQVAVINMSLSASSSSPLLADACQVAADAGILVVAAAGNDGGTVLFPAAYGSVIAVGATDSADIVPWWSNRGVTLELVAPGVSVRSTWKGDEYATKSGTSMATPHVAGVCALMQGLISPPPEPRLHLQQTACDLYQQGRDDTSGYGLVDALEAAATAP